ncbi:MAG: hypothetical protein ACI8QC_004530 [Planctomycetota bacterium]|jgi:hypothetical protein
MRDTLLGDDVVFLCINKGDSSDVIRKYWAANRFGMRAVRQEGNDASDAFGVLGYPTHYVIGPDGEIRYRSTKSDKDALRKALLK